ncbi:MAG: hypothetical protein FWC28_06065 [Proteobacteria bacterium]|nr:hypothetical protein [Cystobacterineae bacterium]MCL2258821.1 hypothetical protein [Cystobacterineae bacterium]MCL2314798.1 hypothetical protein [Pseudomonadota bacterium]
MKIKLKDMALRVPHLSFGFVFAMPEGLIVDVWALPEQEAAMDVLARALVELAVWAKASSELLGKKPSMLLLEGEMGLCGYVLDERRFLMLGFSPAAPLGLMRHYTLCVVEDIHREEALLFQESPIETLFVSLLEQTGDAQTALQRLALRSGLPLESLSRPHGLDAQQLARLRAAVQALLAQGNTP